MHTHNYIYSVDTQKIRNRISSYHWTIQCWGNKAPVKAWSIIEPNIWYKLSNKSQAIQQFIFYLFTKFLQYYMCFHSLFYFSHIHLCQDPLVSMLVCPACCFHESQTLFSLLLSLFRISKTINQLGYKPVIVLALMERHKSRWFQRRMVTMDKILYIYIQTISRAVEAISTQSAEALYINH